MRTHRRILAMVDIDSRGRETARHAWAMAQAREARFALGHVVDWGLDLGADDYSPQTPRQIEERLGIVVRRMLSAIATQIGARDASLLVTFPGIDRGVAELARGWQPDLVVAAAGNDHGLSGRPRLAVRGWTCDAVVIDLPRFGLLSKAASAIAGRLAPGRLAPRPR